MVNTPKFKYFRLQKCASRTLGEYFKKEFNSKSKVAGVHIPCRNTLKDKLFVSSIRNPWDWYVSWYHFTIKDDRVKKFRHGSDGPSTFKEFITKLYNQKNGTFSSMDFSIMHRLGIGPYTYRYINMCYNKHIGLLKKEDLNDDKLLDIDYFIRVEDVKGGVEELYDMIGYSGSTDMDIFNSTKRDHYSKYYTDELIELVRDRERIIVDKFNYEYEKQEGESE